jgi:hypothetical protein
MEFSEALAIVGAATGLTGTALGVMAFVRDRARLYVRLVSYWRGHDEPWFIYVVNAGRQPIPVLYVGLRKQHKDGLVPAPTEPGMPTWGQGEATFRRPWALLRRRWRTYVGWDAWTESAEPLVLKPGEFARFTFSDARPYRDRRNSPDDKALVPIQAFVRDYRGRRAFSNEVLTSSNVRLILTASPTTRNAGD